ncbi:RWD domain-containing protein 2B [Dermatophagoides pteronyssinus]|uniref:RWD domain-containing protein 2B n=1 Tax=Dermatophagoides pteronyssinus TaxID=6956 RepID=UPI003F66D6C0
MEHREQEYNEEDTDDPRIAELILIKSMYPELRLQCLDDQLQRAIDEQNFHYHHFDDVSSITVLFNVDESLECRLTMSVDYPSLDSNCLQIFCHIISNKNQQKQLNERVENELIERNSLIQVVPKIIELWNEMKSSSSSDSKSKSNNVNIEKQSDSHSNQIDRYWIYSHHIYSKIKRKSIIDLCRHQYHLNGFMLIGKPGLICIEGPSDDCQKFWQTIRSWNWQRITMIDIEENLNNNQQKSNQTTTFESFVEYIDRSAVFQMLAAKNSDKIIKNYLGI